MRRTLVLALTALALLGVVTPDAYAQAPAGAPVAPLGAQPFGSAANYKLATYANGDFAGVNLVSTITPNVKAVGSYVSVEENLVGRQCGFATSTCFGVPRFQLRGDDWAVIA